VSRSGGRRFPGLLAELPERLAAVSRKIYGELSFVSAIVDVCSRARPQNPNHVVRWRETLLPIGDGFFSFMVFAARLLSISIFVRFNMDGFVVVTVYEVCSKSDGKFLNFAGFKSPIVNIFFFIALAHMTPEVWLVRCVYQPSDVRRGANYVRFRFAQFLICRSCTIHFRYSDVISFRYL